MYILFWLLFCFCFCFCFLFFVFFLFNNPISSSICKLPIRSEIYNCTFKNTNKVPIIIATVIIIIINILIFFGFMKINDKDPPLRNTFWFVNPLYLIIHYHPMDVNYYSVQWLLNRIQAGFIRYIFLRLSVFNQEGKTLHFLAFRLVIN